jgi:3-hydroxyisobutyrate dehydrogenase-like beta-hydroxyacid dehydrogenase
MSDVSVIGTGSMGSALVEALAGSGAEVTVWNRTRETAEARSRPKIRVAESPAEALSSSPLMIVSVSRYQLARARVDEAGVDLGDKVVASTSPVTLHEAQTFDAVVRAPGGHVTPGTDLTGGAHACPVRLMTISSESSVES